MAPGPPGRPRHRLLRQRPLEPPGRAVEPDPRQRSLRGPADRADARPLLPRHEVDLLHRRQRLPQRRRRRADRRLRDRCRLRLPALPRRGQGPGVRGGRDHERRRVHRLLLAGAARDRRHGLRPGPPRRPRRRRDLRDRAAEGRRARARRRGTRGRTGASGRRARGRRRPWGRAPAAPGTSSGGAGTSSVRRRRRRCPPGGPGGGARSAT